MNFKREDSLHYRSDEIPHLTDRKQAFSVSTLSHSTPEKQYEFGVDEKVKACYTPTPNKCRPRDLGVQLANHLADSSATCELRMLSINIFSVLSLAIVVPVEGKL